MKKKKRWLWFITALLLIILAFPYIKAEYLTARYGDEFAGQEQQTRMLNPAKYYKVIDYSPTQASVFYVSDTGDVITFDKTEDGWQMTDWETIWATTGSSDEFYWPYYR